MHVCTHSSALMSIHTLAECSIVTTTLVPALATKSMAPPIPFTILPYDWRRKLIEYKHTCFLNWSDRQ